MYTTYTGIFEEIITDDRRSHRHELRSYGSFFQSFLCVGDYSFQGGERVLERQIVWVIGGSMLCYHLCMGSFFWVEGDC